MSAAVEIEKKIKVNSELELRFSEPTFKNSNAQIVFIEDDHGIIKATKKKLPHVQVNHVSTMVQ